MESIPSMCIKKYIQKHQEPFGDIHFVPPNARLFSMRNSIYIFEDNEAVIKHTNKGRSPTLRHVSSTRRVDLDYFFDCINPDLMIQI